MFALRAISFLCCTVAALLTASSARALQSRIEDHTDSKIAAKENSKKNHKPSKPTVWNLDGGVFFATDGHLPNGSCFRLSGHMTAPDFFDDLRRIDTDDGTTYKLHNKPVSTYPSELLLTVHLLDFPCAVDLKDSEIRPPLTPELMSTLRLNFFWKDGVAMRPVVGSKRTNASARRLVPYSIDAASELAPRFEFNYLFTVESDSVPLTNDLVLIIENEDHKIAARTAARL
ncbi:MAG TPA: hypothetical protein VGF20_03225 [Candidatus Acidoferrum sp.]|jgi:hypothetical protein